MSHGNENDAPAPDADQHASLVSLIREEGSGLLDLLDEAKAALLDTVPGGTFVNPRPLQEAVLAAWLEANHYRVVPPTTGDEGGAA